MPIQLVSKMGNKQLATPSTLVEEFATQDLNNLIQDMIDTMKEKGGIGIAAPQIGQNKRVILFGFEKSERYPNEKPIPLTILVNPSFEILSHETIDGWEGCLSVPGLRGLVPRYKKIKYTGFDPNGTPISTIAEGFHARVFQHEFDHIEGVLFPQRIKDMRYFGFEEEVWKNINNESGMK